MEALLIFFIIIIIFTSLQFLKYYLLKFLKIIQTKKEIKKWVYSRKKNIR